MAKQEIRERIQAWWCTKPGHPGMWVYTQKIAIDKLAEGYDIEIAAITRYADGRLPKIERGVVL